MTNLNDLVTRLRALAEKAYGNKAQYTGQSGLWVDARYHGWIGNDGTLTDAETTVVLGWLAKARYEVRLEWIPTKETYRTMIHYMIWSPGPDLQQWTAYGDTLPEAVVAAVMQLELENTDDR